MLSVDEVRRVARSRARLLGTLAYTGVGVLLVPTGTGVAWVAEPRFIAWWLDLAIVLVLGVVHYFRERSPIGTMFLAAAIIAVSGALTGATPLGAILIFADLLYLVALRSPSRAVDVAQYASGAVALVGVLSLALPAGPPEIVSHFLWIPLTCALSLWWGRAVRAPRLEADAERARAHAVRRAAESDRQRALASERMAIGRDLHDMLAGHVAGIALQAEAALGKARGEGSATVPGLEAIRASSIAALGEMRSMIDVLRGDGDALSAPPTLADLDSLLEASRAAGVEIRSETDAAALDSAPAATSVAAYRIVQEGLANAAKHSPGRPVLLQIATGTESISIEVRNPVSGRESLSQPLSSGHGLLGVAERARILGGRAEARVETSADGETWVLTAELPIAVRRADAIGPGSGGAA